MPDLQLGRLQDAVDKGPFGINLDTVAQAVGIAARDGGGRGIDGDVRDGERA